MPRVARFGRWLTMVMSFNSPCKTENVHPALQMIFKAFDQLPNISEHHGFAFLSSIANHIGRTMYINDRKWILGSIDIIKTPLLPSPTVSDVAS